MDNSVFAKRLENVRSEMRDRDLQALYIADRSNYFYLTGFNDDDAFVIVTLDKVYLVVDSRCYEYAQKQCEWCEVVLFKIKIYDEVASILGADGVKRVGFDFSKITVFECEQLKAALNRAIEVVDTKGLIEKFREIKDEVEIGLIAKAQSVMDKAFADLMEFVEVGKSEKECSAYLEYRMKHYGADDFAFETIFLSGKRTLLPHGKPSNKLIEENDIITVDFGAVVDGYCSDMTRTFFIGEADAKLKEIYDVVKLAHDIALEKARECETAAEVDRLARDVIEKHGYGEYFGHATGHGIGIDIHEGPTISPRAGDKKLEKNMIFTIEPGIYIPDVGGVRIEDTIVF